MALFYVITEILVSKPPLRFAGSVNKGGLLTRIPTDVKSVILIMVKFSSQIGVSKSV